MGKVRHEAVAVKGNMVVGRCEVPRGTLYESATDYPDRTVFVFKATWWWKPVLLAQCLYHNIRKGMFVHVVIHKQPAQRAAQQAQEQKTFRAQDAEAVH
jgi:hypothetical protein